MKNRRLLSLPFICLYIAAISAVILNAGRSRWGSSGWYPLAVGATAALAIIPLRHMLRRRLVDMNAGDWARIVFFLFMALLTFVAFVYFIKFGDGGLACGMVAMSAMCFWGAFGTIYQWPGFRKPPKPNECTKCRYDLTGNTSGVCPECGTELIS
jgi:hypothetical protein